MFLFSSIRSIGLKIGQSAKVRRHCIYRQLYEKNEKALAVALAPMRAFSEVSPQPGEDDTDKFMAIFPNLVHDLTNETVMKIPEMRQWFSKVLEYNVPDGKCNRGQAVVRSYKILMGDKLTEEGVRLASIAGWCVEMLQARILIDDDLIDGSLTRRNRPCWFRTNNLGPQVVNDAIFVEQSIYQTLRKYFKHKTYYMDIVEQFHDTLMKCVLGECLDLRCKDETGRPRLEIFNMNRLNTIVINKTAYYSFCLPVAIAMYLAGINDYEVHNKAEAILLDMGHYFQVQDDFLDCFGDSKVTGKIGTDIEKGRCSWPVVAALPRADSRQRKIIESCYGQNSAEKVAKIKELYNEMDIPGLYEKFEEDKYSLISARIERAPASLPRELFSTFMEKIYQRKK